MRFILIIVFSFIIGVIVSNAQEDINFKTVESKSLSYYYASSWDSLIIFGKEAEKQGFDYYYLNYRLGVAYYYTSNFFMSSFYLNKAYKQNKSAILDSFFKEKYFLSLLYSKQNMAAYNLWGVADTIENFAGINYKGNLYFFGLYGNMVPLIESNKFRANDNSLISQTNYENSIGLAGIMYSGLITKNIELDFNYNYAKLQMITAVENSNVFEIRRFTLRQNAVNIKPKYWFDRTNNISIAGGFSKVNGKTYGVVDSLDMSLGYANFSTISFMGGMQYEHVYKNSIWGLSGVVSNFGKSDLQLQAGASFSWFPKGNIDFYSITQLHAFHDGIGSLRPIFYQKVGLKLIPKLWLEVIGIYGDVKNFTLLSNNYSYEIPNHTHGLVGSKFIYVLNKHINLFLGAQYFWKYTEKEEISYSNIYDLEKINYQQINVLGGLQWKF